MSPQRAQRARRLPSPRAAVAPTGRRVVARPVPRAAPRPAPRRAPAAIGVDTGGTFTDFAMRVDGALVALKVPSVPRAPERAVRTGLARLGATRTTRVRHGSTVATNTLLERRGARVTLLTTEGFEDLLEIGRQDRPDLYALAPARRAPLVPRERRLGVRERLGPGAERWRPLTASAVAAAIAAARATRPEAIAVGLLHAYADSAHERALVRGLGALGVPITASSALCPEIREFERLATTVANAYLMPRMSTYLRRLADVSPGPLEIVLSHGGTVPVASAAAEPVRQLLSGPAAGLRAAVDVARACGFERALTLDVGGTSTDCAHADGDLPRRRARAIADIPIQLPMLDVHTVGAGGGSIAWVDAGGLLAVGPESAGADPGPACYGRGGPPTLTDALVVLGRIHGAALAGGALALDRAAATRAMTALGRRLGRLAGAAAAEGVVTIAESRMAAALRLVSIERGHDPRGAALVAFGGAGGLHACALAAGLGCTAVVFPRHAGVLSAIGALGAAARRERSRSVLLDVGDAAPIARALEALEDEVRVLFPAAARARVRIERWADLRYRGQSHEVAVPVRGGRRDAPAGLGALAAAFHREHARRYGFADPDRAVEVVTLDVRGEVEADDSDNRSERSESPPARLTGGARGGGRSADRVARRSQGWRSRAGLAGGLSLGSDRAPARAPSGMTPARGTARGAFATEPVRASVRDSGRVVEAAVFERSALAAGDPVRGPAIVVEEGATLWVPGGWRGRVHPSGAVVLKRGAG